MSSCELNTLTALSPMDGRYRSTGAALAPYLSEFGLIRYRAYVEVEYFLALLDVGLPELREFPQHGREALIGLLADFDESCARQVKHIESRTNHDVKAVEYYLRDCFRRLGFERHAEFIHFGLTSQDINDTAIPCALRDALRTVWLPALDQVIALLTERAREWRDVVMLARTHGQPASPTRVGKELMVFVERLTIERREIAEFEYAGKFGGASGNLSAHYAAYPDVDWVQFADRLLEERLRLRRRRYTTQVTHHENLGALFDAVNRVNGVLLDMVQDFWIYIMLGYFSQHVEEHEVGSSAMPHKVNPIDFENAEGNLGLSSALLTHLSRKLATSRLQRDLSDYTLKRNIGVAIGHGLLALRNAHKGLTKLALNERKIQSDLAENWCVISEAVQTILRKERQGEAYEAVKRFTRGHSVSSADFARFIEALDVSAATREQLGRLEPGNYIGPVF